jgi:hypothetical protein
LIRAVGVDRILGILAAEGDLRSFSTLRKQAAWLGRPAEAQMRRFMGSGGRRKSRYAALLTAEAVARACVPAPLDGVLSAILKR